MGKNKLGEFGVEGVVGVLGAAQQVDFDERLDHRSELFAREVQLGCELVDGVLVALVVEHQDRDLLRVALENGISRFF